LIIQEQVIGFIAFDRNLEPFAVIMRNSSRPA
jgi:hypothetical protein